MVTAVAQPMRKQETPEQWNRALQRAISEALDVFTEVGTGATFVESSSVPGTLYRVTVDGCSCPAGARGLVCKHRAALAAQLGLLPLDEPEAARITITGSSDRQTIEIDGRYHGFAAYSDDLGWTLFAGKFPHARKRGNFATLDEIERHLMDRLPVSLPVAPAVPAADLVAA